MAPVRGRKFKTAMGKRVRISNDSVNSFGFRVLTAGMDITQFSRNPVLLLMHERGKVIGFVKDIRKEDGEVTGELVFDEATPESIRVKKQFEVGSLRMVSAGVDIVEMSEDPASLLPGQTRPTVTRSKLIEVSVVDIGSNDDALVLYQGNDLIKLGRGGECPLPLINNKQSNQTTQMDLTKIALALGLDATADEAAVLAKIAELMASSEEVVTLRQEKETMTLAAITKAVETGVAEKRIPADKKEHFIGLGKKIGLEELNATIGAMAPAVKLSRQINRQDTGADGSFKKLSDVPAEEMTRLRKEDRETYVRLFKAEYGFEPAIEEEDE